MGFGKKLLSVLISLAAVLTQLFRISALPVGAEAGESLAAADGNGGCYIVENLEDCIRLTYYHSAKGYTEKSNECVVEGIKAEACLADEKGVVILCKSPAGIKLLSFNANRYDISFIDNVGIKNGCFAINSNRSLFLISEKNNKSILRFDYPYDEASEIISPEPVSCLFTDNRTDRVYGVCGKGVFDTENGSFVICDVPEIPFKYNHGCCTDINGRAYDFLPEKGFERVNAPQKYAGALGDRLLIMKNGKLCLTERDGTLTGALDIEENTVIYPSGNAAALVTKNKVRMVSASDFEPVMDDGRSGSVSKDLQDGRNVQKTDDDNKAQEEPEASVSKGASRERGVVNADSQQQSKPAEEIYRMNNGMMILSAPNTTVAMLKRALGERLTGMCDHNGRRVTSGRIGTGWKAEISGSEAAASYTIIVNGDLTGEGEINNNDIKRLVNCYAGDISVSAAARKAGDMNDDGNIDALDISILHKLIG